MLVIDLGIPYVVITALFSKAGSYGCALLLHHRALVGDSLGRSNITNKLFDCPSGNVSLMMLINGAWVVDTGTHPDGPADPKTDLLWYLRRVSKQMRHNREYKRIVMANDKWRMANGEWRIARGQIDKLQLSGNAYS